MQSPQPTHKRASTTTTPTPAAMALFGQVTMQAPQPLQALESKRGVGLDTVLTVAVVPWE
jgi:hypothetical protein